MKPRLVRPWVPDVVSAEDRRQLADWFDVHGSVSIVPKGRGLRLRVAISGLSARIAEVLEYTIFRLSRGKGSRSQRGMKWVLVIEGRAAAAVLKALRPLVEVKRYQVDLGLSYHLRCVEKRGRAAEKFRLAGWEQEFRETFKKRLEAANRGEPVPAMPIAKPKSAFSYASIPPEPEDSPGNAIVISPDNIEDHGLDPDEEP